MLVILGAAAAASMVAVGSVVVEVLSADVWHWGDFRSVRDEHTDDLLRAVAPAGLLRSFLDPVVRHMLFSPFFFPMCAGIFFLERLFPADRNLASLHPSLFHDFFWHLLQLTIFAALLLPFGAALERAYATYLSGLKVDFLLMQPAWLRAVVAFLIVDFLQWFHHWLRHRVSWFWYFHSVHHSQTRLNMWTDERYHVFEYVVGRMVMFVPLLSLGVGLPEAGAYAIVTAWYSRLYHSNVNLGLGPLRYVLVTPHSHRLHHARALDRAGCNFGVLLSVWDRLFGTHIEPGGDVAYPMGVEDGDFPLESSRFATYQLGALAAQQVYPLRLVCEDLRRALRRSSSPADG